MHPEYCKQEDLNCISAKIATDKKMKNIKGKGFNKQFEYPISGILSISYINVVIGILSCIFGLFNLIRSFGLFRIAGEIEPGILYMISPVPLSNILIDIIENSLLLFCGFFLLFKRAISIRFYYLYCIFLLAQGFHLPIYLLGFLNNGLQYFIGMPVIISIFLLIYFNQKKVINELKQVKSIKIIEIVSYIILSFILIFISYFIRSLLYDYSFKIFC